jgi:hypothetical protein
LKGLKNWLFRGKGSLSQQHYKGLGIDSNLWLSETKQDWK